MMMTSNQKAQDDDTSPPSLHGVPSLSSPTSAYTLPRRKNSILADTEVSDIMDYETFPNLNESRGGDYRQASSPSPSPSLPWFIDYWSASFFRTPALVMDNLCACSGSSSMVNDDDDETYGTTTTTKAAGRRVKTHTAKNSKKSKNITALDDSFRFDISDRSTSVRQWRLRQVVASHDGSLNDDGFYDYSSNTRNKLSSSWTPTMIPGGGIGSSMSMDKRQGKRPASDPTDEDWPSIRKATMVYDKNDHNNVTPFRDGPDPLKPSGSSLDLYSTRMLYTCDSFGYMTPSFEHQDDNADEKDERRQASYSFSSSSRRVPMDDDGREITMTMTMSQPITASTRRYQPVPTMTAATTAPSSPGNETVTTVSLTQSYMREFEDDDDDDTDSDSDSDQEDEEEDSRYMDGGIRRRYDNGRTVTLMHQQQSPFRDHPTPSMMDNLDEDEEDGNDDENDRDNGDDDASATSATFVPTKAYKYLIRMKPQNYIHYKVVDETDYSDGGSGGGVEEEKKDDDGEMMDFGRSNVEKPYGQRRRQTSTSTSTSSSALPFRIQSVPSSCSSSGNNSCSQPHEGDEYNDDDAVFVASTVPPCMPEF